MQKQCTWHDTATDLKRDLSQIWDKDEGKLPETPARLGSEMRRVAPSLRSLGINVTFPRGGGRANPRGIAIRRTQDEPSELSELSEPSEAARNETEDGNQCSDASFNYQSCKDVAVEEPVNALKLRVHGTLAAYATI